MMSRARRSLSSRKSSSQRLRMLTLVATLAAIALPGGLLASAAAAAAPATLKLGSQTLKLCRSTPVMYCGKMMVPLDRNSPAGPFIRVTYHWYPARSGTPKGTVVPVEGGPGYGSEGSVSYRAGGAQVGYASMYGNVLEHWNLLSIDNRGTESSTVIDCPSLQNFKGESGTAAFQEIVGECGQSLNHKWRYPNGTYVHASDLFTTAAAAADMAEIVEALKVGKVDLYGDSYGSFYAQSFATRYPQLINSVVLDSSYQVRELDPWYRSTFDSMPADFDAACSRAPACAAAEQEPAWTRIQELGERLEQAPISGIVPGAEGKREKVTMGPVGLVNLLSDSAEDTQIYRGLDAAARALLEEGSTAPLLRLYAQRLWADEAYFGEPLSEYSVGLYFAVGCLDYKQLFDMSATPAQRAVELAAAEAGLPAQTFAPFSIDQWLGQDENTEAVTGCLDWPAPEIAQPPVPAELPTPWLPASIPVLVLGGELDTWTPPSEVPVVLSQIGGDQRFIEVANSTHVVGEGDTECGGHLVQEFVEDPQAIQTLDASCAPAVSPVHSVGVYPAKLSGAQPLTAATGNQASEEQLRLAGAALETAGDAVARELAVEVGQDHGLYGGQVIATRGGQLLTLDHDQLIRGVRVSGTVRLHARQAGPDGVPVTAELTASSGRSMHEQLTATWTTAGTGAMAHLSGKAGKKALAGTAPAP